MTKFKSYMGDLWRITWINFKSTFKMGNIVGILAMSVLSLLAILLIDKGANAAQAHNKIRMALTQAITYSLLLRTIFVFKDKSNFDKNRVSFITFRKEQVLFSKILSDIILFIAPIIFVGAFGTFYLIVVKDIAIDKTIFNDFFAYFVGLIFVYLITSVGIRYISSLAIDKFVRGAILGLWVLATIGYALIFGMSHHSFVGDDILINLKYMFAFVPIVNVVTPFLYFDGLYEWWTIIPFIVETLIVLAVIWKPISKSIKTHLCI